VGELLDLLGLTSLDDIIIGLAGLVSPQLAAFLCALVGVSYPHLL
jgi:hypothetical protein